MSPGVTEEAGKTAQGVVEALKSTPLVLALVIFNVIFMFLTAYISIKNSEHWDREVGRWQVMAEKAMAYCPTATMREEKKDQ